MTRDTKSNKLQNNHLHQDFQEFSQLHATSKPKSVSPCWTYSKLRHDITVEGRKERKKIKEIYNESLNPVAQDKNFKIKLLIDT